MFEAIGAITVGIALGDGWLDSRVYVFAIRMRQHPGSTICSCHASNYGACCRDPVGGWRIHSTRPDRRTSPFFQRLEPPKRRKKASDVRDVEARGCTQNSGGSRVAGLT